MRTKYNARKTTIDGLVFDSMRESQRWCELQILAAAGKIHSIQRQVPFVLHPAFVHDGKREQATRYLADFTYYEGDTMVIEDVKGVRTAVYRIKRKLLLLSLANERNWRFQEV